MQDFLWPHEFYNFGNCWVLTFGDVVEDISVNEGGHGLSIVINRIRLV